MKSKHIVLAAGAASLLAGCAFFGGNAIEVSDEEIQKQLLDSFKDKGQATLARLNQTPLQKACSAADATGKPLSDSQRSSLEKAALEAVKYPVDSQYLGDWKNGEKIAQTGTGFQFSDDPKKEAGGNCYACHQLAPQELAYGNIGPSLYQYAKLRGNSEEIMKYTWGKIWNSHAYNACSAMPRFGAEGILTEAQIKDVMALLMAADSPVNK